MDIIDKVVNVLRANLSKDEMVALGDALDSGDADLLLDKVNWVLEEIAPEVFAPKEEEEVPAETIQLRKIQFIDKRGTAEHNGWRVSVTFTTDPNVGYVFYESDSSPEGRRKPTPAFIGLENLSNLVVEK